MTQHQMTPPRPIPACPSGHTARYIHDCRRLGAKGGDFIECRCSHTQKHATFDLAWAHWHKMHGLVPAQVMAAVSVPAPQLQLRLVGGTG